MLELFGRGYVIEHCIAAFSKKRDEKAFRMYVTDALKMIAKNTAINSGGEYLTVRYADTIDRTPPPEEDSRSCSEIAKDIWTRIRGEK